MNEFINLILPFLFYCCNIFVLTKKFVKLELKKQLVPDRLLPYFSSFPPIVMNVITKVICLEYAEKISELMPIWEKESIVNENFIKLCVNLLLKHGSFQILRHLLDFSNDTTNSNNSSNTNKDVIYGSRIVLDHLLVELHTFVHTTRQTRKEDNQLIKESSRYWKLLMDQVLHSPQGSFKRFFPRHTKNLMFSYMQLMQQLCNNGGIDFSSFCIFTEKRQK